MCKLSNVETYSIDILLGWKMRECLMKFVESSNIKKKKRIPKENK